LCSDIVLHVHPPSPFGFAGGSTGVNPPALGVGMSTDDELAADISGPTVPRMILGNQLHRFREAASISPDRAGYEIRASRSKISRMENGRV